MFFFLNSNLIFLRAYIDDVSYSSVASSMAKARRDAMPKSPKDVKKLIVQMADPYVRQNYGMTKRHQPKNGVAPKIEQTVFFRTAFECKEFSYCIFAAEEVIAIIKDKTDTSKRTLFADGTFKICPVGEFKQVLIIFSDLYGHVRHFSDL